MVNKSVVKAGIFVAVIYFLMIVFYFIMEISLAYFVDWAGFEERIFWLISFVLLFILIINYFVIIIVLRVTKIILSSIDELKKEDKLK